MLIDYLVYQLNNYVKEKKTFNEFIFSNLP